MMRLTTIKRKMLKFGTLNWQKKTKTLTITYVAVTDISGEFLHADMNEDVHMVL